jgi:hypothetical protein
VIRNLRVTSEVYRGPTGRRQTGRSGPLRYTSHPSAAATVSRR